MKKIPLFLSIIVIMACLLAVSASASIITYNSYEEKENLTYDETETVKVNLPPLFSFGTE